MVAAPGGDGGGAAFERTVRVVVAQRCHLCHAALDVVERVRADTPFALDVVDITGDPELERRYRADIPVVEIDGERAFRYYVHADELRRRLTPAPPPPE